MEKTRDLSKKIREAKGIFNKNIETVKNRNSKDLTKQSKRH